MPRKRVRAKQPVVFLVDRSLGRKYLVEALRAANLTVHALDDHFSQDAADIEWLKEAGHRRWIVLTKDQRIWRNSYEREPALLAGVRMFILTRQDLRADEMSKILLAAMPAMQRRIETLSPPFVFTLSRRGQLTRLA